MTEPAKADDVAAVLALLDEALAIRTRLAELAKAAPFYMQDCGPTELLTFFASSTPSAEYACRLWASANNFKIERRERKMLGDLRLPTVVYVVSPVGAIANVHLDDANLVETPFEARGCWRPSDELAPEAS